MSQDKDAQEPSMEEILSSIRRIIAEEDKERDEPSTPPAAAAGAAGDAPAAAREEPKTAEEPEAAEEEEDVLELTEIADDEPEPAAETPAVESLVAAFSTTPVAAGDDSTPDIDSTKETDPVDTTPAAEGLVSDMAVASSTSALARLTKAMAPEERKPSALAGRSMDDFMTELLRPMLKEWLDQNLAGIVERIVEQEVKKLVRRAELM
jgi:cell pole-organizing protein PopZ